MIQDWNGVKALVTGASKGLGRPLAAAIARRGGEVVMVARGETALSGGQQCHPQPRRSGTRTRRRRGSSRRGHIDRCACHRTARPRESPHPQRQHSGPRSHCEGLRTSMRSRWKTCFKSMSWDRND